MPNCVVPGMEALGIISSDLDESIICYLEIMALEMNHKRKISSSVDEGPSYRGGLGGPKVRDTHTNSIVSKVPAGTLPKELLTRFSIRNGQRKRRRRWPPSVRILLATYNATSDTLILPEEGLAFKTPYPPWTASGEDGNEILGM